MEVIPPSHCHLPPFFLPYTCQTACTSYRLCVLQSWRRLLSSVLHIRVGFPSLPLLYQLVFSYHSPHWAGFSSEYFAPPAFSWHAASMVVRLFIAVLHAVLAWFCQHWGWSQVSPYSPPAGRASTFNTPLSNQQAGLWLHTHWYGLVVF